MSMPVLDLERFGKVRALHDATDSPGERASAARRMKAMARACGLSVAQAKAELDRPKVPNSRPVQSEEAFLDDFDWLFGGP